MQIENLKFEELKLSDIVVGMTVVCQGLLFVIDAYYGDDRPIIIGQNTKGQTVHKSMHISQLYKNHNNLS